MSVITYFVLPLLIGVVVLVVIMSLLAGAAWLLTEGRQNPKVETAVGIIIALGFSLVTGWAVMSGFGWL